MTKLTSGAAAASACFFTTLVATPYAIIPAIIVRPTGAPSPATTVMMAVLATPPAECARMLVPRP